MSPPEKGAGLAGWRQEDPQENGPGCHEKSNTLLKLAQIARLKAAARALRRAARRTSDREQRKANRWKRAGFNPRRFTQYARARGHLLAFPLVELMRSRVRANEQILYAMSNADEGADEEARLCLLHAARHREHGEAEAILSFDRAIERLEQDLAEARPDPEMRDAQRDLVVREAFAWLRYVAPGERWRADRGLRGLARRLKIRIEAA